MDIHQLELFLAVMDSASVIKAATRMRLSPGTVSILHLLPGRTVCSSWEITSPTIGDANTASSSPENRTLTAASADRQRRRC